MTYALFHMWQPFRLQLIEGHKFYIEQAQKRLLSQFHNIDEEANQYGEEWLNKAGKYFDPERHDPADFYEQANDEGIGFALMLVEMHNRTCLSVVAGFYHEWEKQLKSWMLKEIQHWHSGDEVKEVIWRANFGQIVDFFEAFEWRIQSKDYYKCLDRCRLVTNAYKHGDGNSFNDIKSMHPEFVSTFTTAEPLHLEYADHTDLQINDSHISEFSSAIIDFWKDVPEYIYQKESQNVPNWFGKAYEKDQSNSQRKVIS